MTILRELLDWHRRWIRMREIRYRYLVAILDDCDGTASGRPSPVNNDLGTADIDQWLSGTCVAPINASST